MDVLSGILSDTTASSSQQLTTTSDNSVQTTLSQQATYDAGAPGPGQGDMFIYLRNVKVVWLIGNGELGFTVIGTDGERAFPAQDLLSDKQSILGAPASQPSGPVTNLNLDAINMLLDLDPFVGNISPPLAPPRFVHGDPQGGDATAAQGAVPLSITHQVTSTDATSQKSMSAEITDYKPGWLDALFGGNVSTENTITLTYSSSSQVSTDSKQVVLVHVYGAYKFEVWFDTLFGTLAFPPMAPSMLRPQQSVPAPSPAKPPVPPAPQPTPKPSPPPGPNLPPLPRRGSRQ
jgi:hypothetical protein